MSFSTEATVGDKKGSPRTSSSSASTVTSSESDETSSTHSSSSSITSSGSEDRSPSSESPGKTPLSPAQRRDTAASLNATRGAASAPQRQQQQQPPSQQQGYVHLNPELRFERPDNEYIPLPPLKDLQQLTTVLRRLSTDKQRYPEGRHRVLDYFRVAVEMFVTEVRQEYQQQHQSAQRSGRAMLRFTWKNKGELAICFACCCDMVKLLYDALQPGPLKPLWDAFVNQLAPLLILESRVPTSVLTEQTYRTKYMDWQKGGTRYGGEQSTANVRFPSAKDRRLKIETYLRTGAGYRIEAVQVAAAPPQSTGSSVAVTSTASVLAAPRAPPAFPASTREEARPPFAGRLPGTAGVKVPVLPSAAVARPPVKMPMKHSSGGGHGHASPTAATPPLALTSVRQMPSEMKYLFWLSVLAHVKGGEPSKAFPDERIEALPGLLRLCEMTELAEEMCILMDVLAASSSGVQAIFERLGGLLSLRRFASYFIQNGKADLLMRLVEQLARWRITAWGHTSQQAWRTNMSQQHTRDLSWLRTLSLIPEAKRPAWGALLLVMEQRYIFKAPRAEDSKPENPLKRRRHETDTGDLCATLSDAVDMQRWVVPRVNTFSAVRLPVELRVPPLSTTLEEDTVQFINAKRDFAEHMQVEWQKRLERRLDAQPRSPHSPVSIPLWYDPYALLMVTSSDQ